MRKLFVGILLLALAYASFELGLFEQVQDPVVGTSSPVARAYRDRASSVQVTGEGEVVRVLSDDDEGSRHQRFILRLEAGQTLLVVHNIDLAPRVESLSKGDVVQFHGVYEWNARGGMLHWTHHDPRGVHPSGWLKHEDRTYQ